MKLGEVLGVVTFLIGRMVVTFFFFPLPFGYATFYFYERKRTDTFLTFFRPLN